MRSGKPQARVAAGPQAVWSPRVPLPRAIDPMLPQAAFEPFDSPSHIFEVLWDGVRAIAFVEAGKTRLQDRYRRDVTQRYPELQSIARQLSGSGIALDGEIVALDGEGRPDFWRLRERLAVHDPLEAKRLSERIPVTFQAFDILYRQGRSVIDERLVRRKALLRQAVRSPGPARPAGGPARPAGGPARPAGGPARAPSAVLAVPDFVEREGVAFFEAARQHGLEGVIAKEQESRYLPGERSPAWLMLKVYQKDEFVIGGFTYGGPFRGKPGPTPTPKPRGPFASVLLGLYDERDRLRYVGEVSGGFSDANTAETVRALDPLACHECPFDERPALQRLVFWCWPQLAATVRYADWTREGKLRFPLFEALRPDVPAEACRLQPRGVL